MINGLEGQSKAAHLYIHPEALAVKPNPADRPPPTSPARPAPSRPTLTARGRQASSQLGRLVRGMAGTATIAVKSAPVGTAGPASSICPPIHRIRHGTAFIAAPAPPLGILALRRRAGAGRKGAWQDAHRPRTVRTGYRAAAAAAAAHPRLSPSRPVEQRRRRAALRWLAPMLVRRSWPAPPSPTTTRS